MGRPKIDMVGKTFGSWEVVEEVVLKTSSGIVHYLCKCTCGYEGVIQGSALRNGMSKACTKCGAGTRVSRPRPSARLPQGESTRNAIRSGYKASANRRGYTFELSKEYFDKTIHKPCHYCGVTDSNLRYKDSYMELTFNGIDRLDNTKGYTEDNTVACCKICNRAKDVMTVDEFYEWSLRLFTNCKCSSTAH